MKVEQNTLGPWKNTHGNGIWFTPNRWTKLTKTPRRKGYRVKGQCISHTKYPIIGCKDFKWVWQCLSPDIFIIKIWQIGTMTFTLYQFQIVAYNCWLQLCCIDIEICPWVISCAETMFWWSATPWKITEKSVHVLLGNDPNLSFCLLIMVWL